MKSISLHLLMNVSVSWLASYLQKKKKNYRVETVLSVGLFVLRFVCVQYQGYNIPAKDQSTKTVNASISYNTGKYIFSL